MISAVLVAMVVALSPISTALLGGIGGASAAFELFVLMALISACLFLQKGRIVFDGRVLWFAIGLLALSALAEFVHLLQPIPPIAASFSGFRRGGTLLILVLVMVSAGLTKRALPEDVVFTGFKIACIAIAVFSVVLWITFFSGLPDLANPRGTERIVSDDDFVGFNLFAFLALFSGTTALFFRHAFWRYPIMGFAVLLAIALGSRNTLLALMLAYAGYLTTYILAACDRRKVLRIVVLTYLAAMPVIIATVLAPELWEWVWSKVLSLDSAGRGIDSGFTGRTEIWTRALVVWEASPLMGNGFRIFDENPHNGYLQVLAELGVLGFVWFVTLIVWSAGQAFVQTRHRREYGVILAYSLAFASFNLFDSRPLNASNAVTLGFFFLAAYVFGPNTARSGRNNP